MAQRGRDHHRFIHGQFAGWQEHRYGAPANPVTLAKPKALFNADRRRALVDRVARVMKDWHLSPFEHEGPCQHGLREALCLEGHPWRRSDGEATAIVADAIKRLGLERPRYEEGQPDFANGTDYCSWCHGRMDEESKTRKQRFCSPECATMAVRHREGKSDAYEGMVLRSALRLIAKSKAPPKPCLYCGEAFRSDREDAQFCSTTCGSRWSKGDLLLKDIVCEGCGKTAKPCNRGQKFCSQTCRSVTQWSRERARLADVVRECQCCHKDFTPGSERSVYCSPRCASNMANRAYLERNRKPKTIHHFACQCCGEGFSTHIPWAKFCSKPCGSMVKRWDAGKIRWVTPPAFDYMLRRTGARVTDDFRQAA